MTEGNASIVILITTLTVVLLIVIIIVIFSIFQNRKIKFLCAQRDAEQRYEEEIIKSQLETQEQTLQNISWELHDNIGQLLSVARLQLNMLQPNLTEDQKALVNETGQIISKSLQEIRTLSKLLNPEVVRNIGLEEALQLEIDRFNRLNFIRATLNVVGDTVSINQKDEIILFRILQEFLANSLKHSKTSKLNITLTYTPQHLTIKTQDFGIGFDKKTIKKGSGLLNMKSRAKLIDTKFDFQSEKNKGVSLTLIYPLNKENV
ncbi:MAG: ATP-binding protein [Polaribacter sp.]|uniref:sensor histidine kinase n=1 Tax=Polaribacter sp. TaxID=1920175 RepID=UPI002F35F7CE